MTKTRNLKFIVLTTSILFATLMLCACVQQDNKIKDGVFPNTVAENAKIDEKYKSVSEELSKDAINEFMNNITKIPRLPGEEKVIKDYIKTWATNNNLKAIEDKSGCLYIDVPATQGYENYPKVILQGHLDMVGTTADGNIDMHKTPVDAVYDEKDGTIMSKDNKTTIGADDGEGIVTMLSIAKNKDVKHGPLRLLFTYEEETTMNGAKLLSPEVLDAPYLINIDCGPVGVLIESSAGGLIFDLESTQETETVSKNIVTIGISDLKGGHSAAEITKPRMSAHDVDKKILNKLNENSISYNLVSWNGGTATNSITVKSELTLAVEAKNTDKIKSLSEEVFNKMKEQCTDDKDASIEFTDNGVKTVTAFTKASTQGILEALNDIPQGVIKEDPEYKDTPITSCNTGVINFIDGNVHAGIYFRSSEESAIVEMNSKIENFRDKYKVNYKITNRFPAWPKSEKNTLTKMFVSAYKNAMNIEALETKIHGGLECSFLYQKKPDIEIACIGADVKGEHATTETFYTKSLPAHFASILYTLDHINETKEG
ncbi:MAG: M20/M25/M40 family metallo-hydrolase [Coriobacteriia bacterium]|nr:M20/M25/M40 family metallo-hydrolase [Coriobacteriia bacterium]